MKLKALQMNDDLPLTLGAKVGPKPIAPAAKVDIDLTVKWVGDIMHDDVQVSDLNHAVVQDAIMDGLLIGNPAFAEMEARLFGDQQTRVDPGRPAMTRLTSEQVGLGLRALGVDPGLPGGDHMAITVVDYAINGIGGYTEEQYLAWVAGSVPSGLLQQAQGARVDTVSGLRLLQQEAEARRNRELCAAVDRMPMAPYRGCGCSQCRARFR